jgi:Raf kinase inhibitor-like YbhB/YbcL family protein
MRRRQALAALAGSLSAGCVSIGGSPPTPDALVFESPAFGDDRDIPARYTCDGAGESPPFTIDAAPEPTEAFALVVEYAISVAEVFSHWQVWNIPPDTTDVPAGLPATETLPDLGGARQGTNQAGTIGYAPICPPPGGNDRYFAWLYALRKPLDLEAGAGREAFEDAIEGPTIASVRLVGTYSRDSAGTETPLGE